MFIFGASGVHDTITDFSPENDKLKFTMSAADFKITAASDGHAVMRYGDDTVDLLGVTADQLDRSNVILPAGSNAGRHDHVSHMAGDWAPHHGFHN